MKKRTKKARVIDLFCGVGGLTHGFVRERGFKVLAGVRLRSQLQVRVRVQQRCILLSIRR